MDTDIAADIAAPVSPPARPGLRSLWVIWAGIAFVLSWVLWGLDGSFYARLGVPQNDWPKWSMVEALLGTPALAAWAIVAALWLWWPRRRVVALVALAAVVVGTAGTSLWVRHEAERARGGTPVWPAAVLPFSFSARAVTLLPLEEPLPAGLPARVLLLRDGPDTSVVYDPATGHLWWVGKRLATWSVTAGGRAWG